MTYPPRQLRQASLCAFALLIACGSWLAHGQANNEAPAGPGWASAWTEPANEQQRQAREFFKQCAAAARSNDFQGVINLCGRLLQREPDSTLALTLRAEAYQHLKRYALALDDLRRAREFAGRKHLTGTTAELWLFSAHVHVSAADYHAALADLQTSLKLDQSNAQALNSLAWLQATAPDGSVRDGRAGVHWARRALALLPPSQTYAANDTLAAAYAESGDYPRAVEYEKRAMADAAKQIKDHDKDQLFQRQATQRLQLFEQHQPYHSALP